VRVLEEVEWKADAVCRPFCFVFVFALDWLVVTCLLALMGLVTTDDPDTLVGNDAILRACAER